MLPENIPTVTITGRYLAPNGRPLTGTVTFRAPAVLTFPNSDVILGGPVVATLNAAGQLEADGGPVVLPATDAPGMDPAGWSYVVTEQLAGVPSNRSYNILLPAEFPFVDLADIAPTDPSKPNYIPVEGAKGDPGATGPAGVVQSVNGKSAASITLTAAEVGALASTAAGATNGVATLDADGKVPSAQLPTTGGAVASVNGKTGTVVLTASDVGALDQAAGDARYVQPAGIPVTSVAGKTGAVALVAADVGAEAAGTAVLLTGAQTVAGAKTFSSVPSSSAAPSADNHLARKSYVDALGGGEWRASDLGLLTWAFDPVLGHSAPLYPGSGPIRVTAVYLRSAASVTRIVWHFGGYAGGLTTGSWAALYNSAGTRVAQTADLSTAGAEPAEVHNAGGATVSSPLTAAYSAAAGLYYVAWRFQYNTTTGDGPMMLVAESSFSAPPNVFGLNNVRRFGSYPTGAATAPASLILGSMENGSNRFWTGLA